VPRYFWPLIRLNCVWKVDVVVVVGISFFFRLIYVRHTIAWHTHTHTPRE
jgi:hypothetical protein